MSIFEQKTIAFFENVVEYIDVQLLPFVLKIICKNTIKLAPKYYNQNSSR